MYEGIETPCRDEGDDSVSESTERKKRRRTNIDYQVLLPIALQSLQSRVSPTAQYLIESNIVSSNGSRPKI